MAFNKLPSILKPQDLGNLMSQRNVRLVDARVGANIQNVFDKEHLAGAVFANLDTDLADIKPNAANGGRHPLPEASVFAQFLGKIGISPTTHVVVYDDKNGANAAARFWWMLRALGHQKVQVLDGGIQAAIKQGIPTSDSPKKPRKKAAYPQTAWQLPTADLAEVEKVAQNPNFLLIDVRDAYRYRGESEPIDLVAGHIPGAVNQPFSLNLEGNGHFKTPEILRGYYEVVLGGRPAENVIVHCGSGVTACHTLLALDYAGFEVPKMYVGSWSEWSRNDKPIGVIKN
jgi:thiosulfate/3-mercaptopyruvate sulfurtransferase